MEELIEKIESDLEKICKKINHRKTILDTLVGLRYDFDDGTKDNEYRIYVKTPKLLDIIFDFHSCAAILRADIEVDDNYEDQINVWMDPSFKRTLKPFKKYLNHLKREYPYIKINIDYSKREDIHIFTLKGQKAINITMHPREGNILDLEKVEITEIQY